MCIKKKIESIIDKYNFLGSKLHNMEMTHLQITAILKERASLKKIYDLGVKYLTCLKTLRDSEEIISDLLSEKELKLLAVSEKEYTLNSIVNLENQIKLLLIPQNIDDEKESIIEIRVGTGGDEASLFVLDLLHMYTRFFENKKWSYEILSSSRATKDGLKEVIISVNKKCSYKMLKFESGVHRVQRVPNTESNGRIHTSAATVAVLPQVEDVDVNIKEEDLRIDAFRGSGAGGQHVNTTDSAIRITHLPTGIMVVQGEKSQHQNKVRAMKILMSRLYEVQQNKSFLKRANIRKGLIGSGDRSQKIRTYNFPQSRIIDHRINTVFHNLNSIIFEGKLDCIIDSLIERDVMKQLSVSTK